MIARVILDIKHQNLNQMFDYLVPEKWEPFLSVGMRVTVPLNETNRLGYVVEFIDQSPYELKEIIDVLDIIPTIEEETFVLADKMEKEYFIPKNVVFNTIIPKQLLVSYNKEVHILKKEEIPLEIKSFYNTKGVWKLTNKDLPYTSLLRRLKRDKVVELKTTIKQKSKDKLVKVYQLSNVNLDKYYSKYPQLGNLKLNEVYKKETLIEFGFKPSNITTLTKHNVLIEAFEQVFRGQKECIAQENPIILTDDQTNIVNQVLTKKDEFIPFLLKGISSSGKTETYFEIIDKIIEEDKQVMVLVPEISLIPQMYERLSKRFKTISVFHSGLSLGERHDAYKLIRNKKTNIILGTRAAIFIPIDLGLIVLDEAHDESYIQKEGAFYDAKDLALTKAKFHNVPILFVTSTPSVEMMYLANKGDYQLLELNKRINYDNQPILHFVDMKNELVEKNTSIFSRTLIDNINERLTKKEQTILFLNKRGYAPFVLCRACGYTPKCPNCDIVLTYYKKDNKLSCNYCSHTEEMNHTCAKCGSDKIREVGVGIERVVEQIRKTFPTAKVLQIDSSITKTKDSHERLFKEFEIDNIDILVGTQMISKGLDFANVTLVGILMADLLLEVPHYFASEQAYMLIKQASGRSGRFAPGDVIIQGYNLDLEFQKQLKEDYEYFYKNALYQRKLGNYPPFKKVAQIMFEGDQLLKTYQTAFQAKKLLQAKDIIVLGPIEPKLRRTKNKFTFTITLKYDNLDYDLIIKILNDHPANIFIRFIPSLIMM